MSWPEGPAPLALRIDVDFTAGLRHGVPRMLDALARTGMRATFCVVGGSNAPARSLRRLGRPGYLRRLWRLGPRAIARWLLPAWAHDEPLLASADARGIVRRILVEGHELAVHGHDHAWWAEHVWQADAARLFAEIDRGYAALDAASGRSDLAWASPAWRTTPAVLRRLAARGVPYLCDCWGRAPFLTLDDRDEAISVPHLPINVASLEALVLARGMSARAAAREALSRLDPRTTAVVCAHDYYEGLMRPDVLEALLEECRVQQRPATTLLEASRQVLAAPQALGRYRLRRAPVPGFSGAASWQDEGGGLSSAAPARLVAEAPAPA